MDVTFVTEDGGSLEVELGYFDTVMEIKRKIENCHGIPVSQQRLLVGDEGDEAMEDDLDIGHYGVCQDSFVRLQIIDGHGDGVQITGGDDDDVQIIGATDVSKQEAAGPAGQATDPRLARPPKAPTTVAGPSGPPSPVPPQQKRGKEKMIMVNVQSLDGSRVAPVGVYPSEAVGVLRGKLVHFSNMLQLPEEYFFICRQDVLDERRSFRDQGVGNGSVIEVFPGSIADDTPAYLDTQ